MKEIDNKVSSLLEELQNANADKNTYKHELSEYKRLNGTLEAKANKSKEKCIRMKMDLSTYEKRFKELEKEFQKVSYQREITLKENDMARDNIKKTATNKIQV